MPIWRQPDGTIYRDPVTCNVVNCPTPPCDLLSTACCPNGLPRTLTLSWPSSTGGDGSGSGGSLELAFNDVSAWTFTGVVPGAVAPCSSTIVFECFGADENDFEITGLGGSGGGSATLASASCSPYLGTLNQPLDTGCITLNDATVTE